MVARVSAPSSRARAISSRAISSHTAGPTCCCTAGGQPGLANLVVEVNAGRAPHHHLVGLIALEELEGVIGHAARRRRVALLMVHDAAAVRGSAHRDVVEAETVEDRVYGLNHVRGAENIAAEVEDDLVPLDL